MFKDGVIHPLLLDEDEESSGGNAGTLNRGMRRAPERDLDGDQSRVGQAHFAGRGPAYPYPDFAPPGFEDEHRMAGMFRDPLSIGHDDAGPNLAGPRFGGGRFGVYGERPVGGEGERFNGMHPTIDSPLFGARSGQRFPPTPDVPAGARYDPVGPGDQRGGLRQPGQGTMGNAFPDGPSPPGYRDMFM
ncbi:hypothetical protein NEOLI_002486 [Neolecta irregularis DAH-3]|uniref:PI31 proteasome regulator C-terminal domain-containing protein n=1 Tax=Neolecta irregularis (strain DAH-3) TaxID=1198029 RepID=A0A1U7LS24_NEOID|nr:hypothetical protein NEOLI_002486 [Neolecta irregularis DAH-3]|eukprot:OLL25383.1 hypothetical protein NEOLI_002486 [Neolecta irregularis DAH-3]